MSLSCTFDGTNGEESLAQNGSVSSPVELRGMTGKPSALIVAGGWEGHEPLQVASLFASILEGDGFGVHLSNSLDSFADRELLASVRLIIPVWTMGEISGDQVQAVLEAAGSLGVGVAGCHGGMCDAFRNCPEWQFLTGGQWVAHPGDDSVEYTVRPVGAHPIMDGIDEFKVKSEQYYMHVDPAIDILATTRFPVADGPHVPNGSVDMPVVWTKRYGAGKVFYCSLGHKAATLATEPIKTIMRRGFLWAAKSPN